MSNPDMALAVERAMTSAERERFNANFLRLNPAWRGATCADILDSLDSVDAHLDVIEPLYLAHQSEVPEPGLLSMATYAAIYVNDSAGDVERSWVGALAIIERMRADG